MGHLARELGVPFWGEPGRWNAITDVPGVEVGHVTLIEGSDVRTGVTAILPRGQATAAPVFAGWFSLSGNGEMTGTAWVEESGFLDGPVMITNTHSVGVVRDSVVAWQIERDRRPAQNRYGDMFWSLPLVSETYDGFLNDTNGFHVKRHHVFEALDTASSGPVEEGNVGGGTGMVAYGFKGGIGTASRVVDEFTLGVLVQTNMGQRYQLSVAGVPVGREITEDLPAQLPQEEMGSIIIVVATDAPLLPHQLDRVAKRATMGLARTGSNAHNGSGDLFLAFSTAEIGETIRMLPNERVSSFFDAVVEGTEEAILNAMLQAKTMTGRAGHTVTALPHDRLKAVLQKYNRLT
jgi:L-aminopeptidase/D-esterase-like protein